MSEYKKSLKYILYLASGSQSRKNLLSDAQIPFAIIPQFADESVVSLNGPLQDIVQDIAMLKMKHVQIPEGKIEGQIIFILTADTLTLTGGPESFEIFGKPKDRDHAKYMIKSGNKGSITGTAFCVQKLIWKNSEWNRLDQEIGYAEGWNLIDIPDSFIDFYLDHVDYMNLSGAIKIRGFCEQFTKEVRGSYSAIMGLPMYELRGLLMRMGFYE
ncbi:Maf family protein [Candidatus Dependentiae bacterium]|nr:Maf family protein [Candidatus Dependentiae bacterium]